MSFGGRPGDQDSVAGGRDAGGDRGDLGRCFSLAEHDLREALPGVSLVIDLREAEIFVGFLAQNLKEPVLRRLRGKRSRAHVVE